MELHGRLVDGRLQCIVGVRQIGEVIRLAEKIALAWVECLRFRDKGLRF